MSQYPVNQAGPWPTTVKPNPFADHLNPYAAPTQPLVPQGPAKSLSPFAGVWRQGNKLVMHKLAPLPDICLKSNLPSERRLKRKLQWHHPAILLAIFAGLLVYVILAIVLTKRATILVPLTLEWYERRKRRLIFAWCAGLASLAMMVAGMVMLIQTNAGDYAILLLVGFIAGIVALIFGQSSTAMVTPTRITDEYVWLKGVHPDYLNRLEVWPYNV